MTDKTCIVCNSPTKIDRHRIIPGYYGGEYISNNIVYLCKQHHSDIHVLIRRLSKRNELNTDQFVILLTWIIIKYKSNFIN